jgi:geranylgeranyl diphosphate synthase type II
MSEGLELAGAVLREYGDVTRIALVDYLRPREPHRHLYGPVTEYPRRGGRMLRPSICIATARVFGAATDDARRTAVALELLHNAFLVHDDVEDESEARRGRPTLNAALGAAIAVNVGDGLALTALRAFLDNRARLGPHLTVRLVEEAERATRESIEGQAIELGWRRDNATHVTEADYLEMVLKKTCWYTTIFPSRAGALIATRGEADVERFVRFGFFLGAAFQVQDDLLNLIGDERRYGKELGGDLWEGKRTLMLLRLLEAADADERARLVSVLAHDRRDRTAADVSWMRQRMDAYGCVDHARGVAHALAGAARHEAELLYAERPDSRDKRFLTALPEWVLARR